MPTMRAARFHEYGGPEVFAVDIVEQPSPGPGEVLVDVRATTVNAMEWKLRSGRLRDSVPLRFPALLGTDCAGVVTALGDGVTSLRPGDDVFGRGSGTYAEFALARETDLAVKPAALTFDSAALLPIAGLTAWAALDAAEVGAGTRLLVQGGGGGMGSMMVQLAHRRGARVAATASTDNLAWVRSLGADEVIDYTNTSVADAVTGLDAVIDTVGGRTVEQSWPTLRAGGLLVSIVADVPPGAAAEHGVRTAVLQHPDDVRERLAELGALAAAGEVELVVSRTFPLAEAGIAQSVAETGHRRGRVVIHPSQ